MRDQDSRRLNIKLERLCAVRQVLIENDKAKDRIDTKSTQQRIGSYRIRYAHSIKNRLRLKN